MRVVAGLYRHRTLLMPISKDTRPTKDMVKEAFFSAISSAIKNATVLDLFAGSGSLGIEAISRGADKCVFIDSSKEAYEIIKKNLSNLNILNGIVFNLDYLSAINKLKDLNIKFDLIILDPPYKYKNYLEIIGLLEDSKLVKDNAIFVLESDYEITINKEYKKIKNYKYGKTFITILWK